MIQCEEVRELLPWYANGRLDSGKAAQIAAHMQSCEACRSELVEVLWVRQGFIRDTESGPPIVRRVWRRIASKTGVGDAAQVDVGSFLVGFQLGVSSGRRGAPIEAKLRLMGHNVRIIGRKRRSSRTTQRKPS